MEENLNEHSGSQDDNVGRDKFESDEEWELFQQMLNEYQMLDGMQSALDDLAESVLEEFKHKITKFHLWAHAIFARPELGELGSYHPKLSASEYYNPDRLGQIHKIPEELLISMGYDQYSGVYMTILPRTYKPTFLYLN